VNVLILGGHGFIGSHIVELLSNTGHSLRVLARKKSEIKYKGELILGDFFDDTKLSEALVGIDTVVHCISTTVPKSSEMDPIYDIKSNLIGIVRLLQLMKAHNVPNLIFLSSGGTVYGNSSSSPITEDSALNPVSSYGAVKVAMEKFIGLSELNWGVKSIIIRPSNPYGERQGFKGLQGLISVVLKSTFDESPVLIYGDGSMLRDYVYVQDVAKLICRAIDSNRSGIYNAGSGVGHSVNQIISTIEKVSGKKVQRLYQEARSFDVKNVVLSSELTQRHFGWKSTTTLESGIRKQYEWLKGRNDSANR